MRLVLSAVLAVCALGPPSARAADPGELRIGMLSGMFRDQQPRVIQALARPFRDLMTKHVGYSGDVEVIDCPFALCEKLKENKVQLGVFHGFEFAWAQQKHDDLVPIIVTMPPGGMVQGLIVVRDDSAAKTVADLKASEVLIPRGAKAHTLLFLDKARDGLPADTAKPTPKTTQTPEEVLNAVVAGEAKAALVDWGALNGYKVLQPGSSKSLRVLVKSEEFPPAVICYRKGTLTDEQVAKIRDGMAASTKTPTGKMLMTLWNLKGFEAPPKGYQASLDDILKAYPAPKGEGKAEAKTSTGGSAKTSREPIDK